MSYGFLYDEGQGPELMVYSTYEKCLEMITPEVEPYVISDIKKVQDFDNDQYYVNPY